MSTITLEPHLVELRQRIRDGIVSRDSTARERGGVLAFRCVAHEDTNPSAWLGDAAWGCQACQAGGNLKDLADRIGMEIPRSNGAGLGKTEVARYRYTDARGSLLYEAIRYALPDPPYKTFSQQAADGSWEVKRISKVPYRLPEVVAAVGKRRVFIVEGEKDADRLAGLGLVATCNVGGAGNWQTEISEHFQRAVVVILPDNDDPGMRHALDVAAKLQGAAAEVRIMELPGLGPRLPKHGKDVSDWLDAGGTVDQLKDLARSAPIWTPDMTGETTECPGQPSVAPRALLRTLADVLSDPDAMKEPEAVIPRLAYAGRLTLLSAREKEGKSTLASAGAAAVSDGARFLGEMGKAGTVLWVGLEEHPGDTARRFQGFGAQGDRVFLLEQLEKPFADLAAAVEQSAAVLVVVDTLSRFAETLVKDAGSSTEWTPVMAGFTRVARETGAAVLLLHHARKDGGYRDSTAIGAGVDALFEMTAGDEAAIRKIKGRGRWAIEDFAVRLEDNRYTLTAGELTLDARVLLFIESNPGCSMRAVTGGVSGRTEAITATVTRLLSTGAIQDRGDPAGRKLYPKDRETGRETVAIGGVSHGNPQGNATETPLGNGSEGERFPFPTSRGADGETPIAMGPATGTDGSGSLRLIYESPRPVEVPASEVLEL